MTCFQLGQKVLITGPFTRRHRGRAATVVSIQPSVQPNETEKYVVQFDEGGIADFYGNQLMTAPEEKGHNA
jgi:hypothetical protein